VGGQMNGWGGDVRFRFAFYLSVIKGCTIFSEREGSTSGTGHRGLSIAQDIMISLSNSPCRNNLGAHVFLSSSMAITG
jgi:hypothetical protein